jgi:hypothetical protein
MTRTELVANVKRRAREYVGQGDYRSAVAIMLIDLTQFAMYAAAAAAGPVVRVVGVTTQAPR